MHWDDTVPDGAVRIPLRARDGSIRAYTLVDATDANWVNQWRWYLDASGYAVRGQYLPGRGRGRNTRVIRLHRELLGLTHGDDLEGDHISRNRLDNRRANLRPVPQQGRANMQNMVSHAGSTSSHRGVYWDKWARKWRAQIGSGNTRRCLGSFDSEIEAAEVARAARAQFMPFAVD
jgi:hypothetical protein